MCGWCRCCSGPGGCTRGAPRAGFPSMRAMRSTASVAGRCSPPNGGRNLVTYLAGLVRAKPWCQKRWNTRRGTRTTPRYSPISTPNSTADRSVFQRASSGKVKNMATALPIELAVWQNTPIMPDIGKSPWASTAERYPRSRLSRSRAMPLTSGLLDVLLSHPCPRCGHRQEKKGSWFKTISHYTCPSCGPALPDPPPYPAYRSPSSMCAAW